MEKVNGEVCTCHQSYTDKMTYKQYYEVRNVPHALRPYVAVILHLNTNNVCFYSAFGLRTRVYGRAYKCVIEMQARDYVRR